MRLSCRRLGPARIVALVAALTGHGLPASGIFATGCAAQATQPAVVDELLVGFTTGTTSAEAEAVYAALGATKVEEMRQIGVHRIRVAPGSIESVERALKQSPAVRFVERNRPVRSN
jgi:hypothetical protein